MLNSLEIQNYRNFKHLRIEKLGRVNLIIGKNNTGKTSLLEAVGLYEVNDRIGLLKAIFKLRGELHEEYYDNLTIHKFANENIILLKSIFHQRKIEESSKIIINGNGQSDVELSFKYLNDNPNKFCIGTKTYKFVEMSISTSFNEYIFLDEEESLIYVAAQCIYSKNSVEDWGKIALTEKEQYVIQALNIIDSSIQRFAYVAENNEQKAKVSLSSGEVVNLRSMGDGINRILTIILSMVNCQDGYFLVDEFDNGLHHSVQKQLWEIVFYLANKLNIQVFATTHSYDCIKAFEAIANEKEEHSDALLIKLIAKNDNIVAKTADITELKEIVEDFIDIR